MIKYSSNNKITEKPNEQTKNYIIFWKICEAPNESFNPLKAFKCCSILLPIEKSL